MIAFSFSITTALHVAINEYPDDALSKIHKRHFDRLDPLSTVARLASTDGKYYDTILYNERGVMEICRWSNKPKANLFMDWVWAIIEKYRHNELQSQLNLQPLIDSLSILTQTITTMQQDINTLKESQSAKKLPEKKYSRWKTNIFNKLNTLLSYVNIPLACLLLEKIFHKFFVRFVLFRHLSNMLQKNVII